MVLRYNKQGELYQKARQKGACVPISSLSKLEQHFIALSDKHAFYPHERIQVIEVENIQMLGKLAALKFILWVIKHPTGVICMPTGKTAQAFIAALQHVKQHWHTQKVQDELAQYGIVLAKFPQTSGLRFVQMDEFFLMYPGQKNSFSSNIQRTYLQFFQIPAEQSLLMDFSAMGFDLDEKVRRLFVYDRPCTLSEQEQDLQDEVFSCVQKFCNSYEKQIQAWGGIGFFLGGIGPDGHVAFNISGSEITSTTRLLSLNYPSAAAAAVSLGGIEYARNKLVMTIGIATILHNPEVEIIIIASGESKAEVVAKAVQGPVSSQSPCSYFQSHKNSTFIVTRGAACMLYDRAYERMKVLIQNNDQECIDQICIQMSLDCKVPLLYLQQEHARDHIFGKLLFKNFNMHELCKKVHDRLVGKLHNGMQCAHEKRILHTAPHHDDIMLSYYTYIQRMLHCTTNLFLFVTSGFNSVTNRYMLGILKGIDALFIAKYEDAIFKDSYESILQKFVQAFVEKNVVQQKVVERIIMARTIKDIYEAYSPHILEDITAWLWYGYFPHVYPGKKDTLQVQMLKGAMRESEEDRTWSISGISLSHIVHLRSRFYTGDYFTPQPTIHADARPIASYLQAYKPDIITVALDPEGTGPDTHYKVMQVVAEALRMYTGNKETLQIWGYRNVWHRFMPHEATHMIIIHEEEIEKMEQVFLACFSTQKSASFPAIHFDGPFSELMRKQLHEQFGMLQTLLGNDHHLLQKGVGCIFLKAMNCNEFLDRAQRLSMGPL